MQGALEKLILVIKRDNISEEPVERFVLDFEWLVPRAELARPNWRSVL